MEFKGLSRNVLKITLYTNLTYEECVQKLKEAIDPAGFRLGYSYTKEVYGNVNDGYFRLYKQNWRYVHPDPRPVPTHSRERYMPIFQGLFAKFRNLFTFV